jgi:hypothetical protein
MFGSKAFTASDFSALTYVPSVTEGVLDSAERGGYRLGPGTVATPLDQKSLRRHPIDVWTPISSLTSTPTRAAIAVPLSHGSRIPSGMS